ncbi:MAG: YidC/Oxa1 family membrane protein insertase [Clostridia bacterium]|nr:YidC/Oxa1 family membrane protein insertase [Clostridia bacterium]
MKLFNLLTTPAVLYDKNLLNIEISGMTQVVKNIIEFFSFGGLIAVGILLFSLILKIIPLPFDIYSRVASKKNALKMEKMRPELERLQKQYANNKELYNQKLMAFYKKQGYSQFAACLPSIFTLVFFIIVISAFQQYSTYCKIEIYEEMAIAYSDNIRYNDNITVEECGFKENGFDVDENKVINVYKTIDEKKAFLESKRDERGVIKTEDNIKFTHNLTEDEYNTLVKIPAQKAAAEKYKEISKKSEFLWVKNIWVEDLPWKNAFVDESTYLNSVFTNSKGCSKSEQIKSSINNKNAYNDIFGDEYIQEQMKKPNGYMILVVISIGSMLLSQLIMNKTQKAQMELQSVDGAAGQAAQTTKMMTWMMPIMFGIFSFMYSASFSLYLIVSTLFSTASTAIINKIVEKKFIKEVKREEELEYQKRYGHLKRKKED